MDLSIGHYLSNMSKLTNQWNNTNYKDPDRQRVYLKDIDCPQIWHDKLEGLIPPGIFYLNNSTGDIGGPGAIDDASSTSPTVGRGVAMAGDLMSCLPPAMRADNMQCYIGHEGTYTPAHREMCASLGQNLMVETSGTIDEEGKPAKPGSSIWFMTETNDRHLVSEYWLSTLGHDIEVENHFAQINAWKAAPFTTYIVEQRAGDFILIPPLAPHQVWNRGTRTMKAAWNRTTVETLEMALHEALPRARMVCRDEQYKNKAIIYFALQKYSELLKRVDLLKQVERDQQLQMDLKYSTKIRQLRKDFRRLFALFTEILLSESLNPVSIKEKPGQYLPYDSFVTCSYCRCNIFNRFLTCTSCVVPLANGDEDTYDICMDCFVMGRSCACISNLTWVEQFPWQELIQKHELWRHQIIGFDGGVNDKSPRSLQTERKSLGKKTLAQICQEQLKVRPWNDPNDPKPTLSWTERVRNQYREENDDGEEGSGKKKKKTRRERLEKHMVVEHVSCHPREKWKCAICTKCEKAYSYGCLWRMFDLMPVTVMENPEWECPACRKICSCASCRKKTGTKPYEPNGTVLGHDTKKVADPRSVESLVDFGTSNMHSIKKSGDDHPLENRRVGRRIDEAARAKAKDPELDENYIDDEEPPMNEQFYENGIRYTTGPNIPIDPMLGGYQADSQFDGYGDFNQFSAVNQQPQSVREYEGHSNQADGGASIYGSGIGLRPPTGQASLANMGHHREEEPSFASNGNAFEYPDPSFNGTMAASDFSNGVAQRVGASNQPAQNESNEQFRQAQRRQILEEARRNDRYISAEAAFSKMKKMITLRVPRIQLAALAGHFSHPSNTLAAPVNASTSAEKELVQSDLPSVTPQKQVEDPSIVASKKRKMRAEEIDDDFSTRKRRDRKSNTAKPMSKEKRTSGFPKYADVEASSDSEAPLVEDDITQPASKSQGPRPLPKYLADRTGDDEDFPTELVEGPPRRRKPPKTIKRVSLPIMRAKSPDLHPTQTTSSPMVAQKTATKRGRPRKTLPAAPTPAEASPQTQAARKGRPRASLPLETRTRTWRAPSIAESSTSSSATPDFKASEPADPVQHLAEENRKAKMKAVQWANENEPEDSDSSSSEEEAHKSAKMNSKLMAVPTSIFSRPGMAGKKIKIAGIKPSGVNGASGAGTNSKS